MAKVRAIEGEPAPGTIRFKYLFADDFKPEYANGAQGTITSQQELAISFFLERAPLPYSETHAVVGDELGKQIAKEPAGDGSQLLVLRQVTNGVLMNVDTAQRVHDMLGRLIELVKSAKSDKGT